MRRRAFAALAIAALVCGALAPTAVVAKSPTVARFQRINVDKIDPKLLPALIDPSRVMDVMVQLADQPVASQVGDARDNGTTVTKSQRDTWRTQIQAKQKPVADAVRKSGGVVVSQMQDAYNGIHVHVKAAEVTSLASMSGVSGIHLIPVYKPALTESVPYVGAPQAWTTTGYTGAGIKIAIIDTGIDYYHADFGGSGSVADYGYGLAHDTTAPGYDADGTTVAFPSAKVPVGYDFVGDAYDASAPTGSPATVPQPDANPLDCNSHGTHTASTAAGQGVLASGSTYTGPYNASIYGSTDFRIGPGVAPQATLYIYRVFGCEGSTDVVTEAINRAVIDGADVISMSLGSDFGTSDTPDAIAADNAARAGVVVVASSGNEGPNAYMTGTPGTSSRTLSVAAVDTNATFPGATIHLASGDIAALNANGRPLPVSGNLNVLTSGSGIALGCDISEYAGVSAGDIVVTQRGVCPRVDRVKLGQSKGAAAVIMVNTSAGLPPFEGPIAGVTIPFIGVEAADGAALLAANGDPVTISSAGMMANPTYKNLVDFSSWGPRAGDSALKPEVAAPGVSIVGAGMGTGNDVLVDSGTSMAAPHVAGIAALVIAAHPDWSVNEVKAAIMSTADDSSAKILGYNPVGAGSGVAQAQLATTTAAIALTRDKLDSLSFDNVALGGSYWAVRSFTIENKGASPITYKLSAAFVGSSAGVKISVSPSKVIVPAHQSREIIAKLTISAAAVKALPFADTFAGMGPGAVLTATGVVTATPTASGTGVYPLHVPFLVVPRGLSDMKAGPPAPYKLNAGVASTSVKLHNSGIHVGTADVYAWGIVDKDHTAGIASVRAVGVQSQPGSFCGADDTTQCLIFAVNSWHQWSNAAAAEFDIAIDTNGDGAMDFVVFSYDDGYVFTGSYDGILDSFTFDVHGNFIDAFYADAPMNGSVIELPALASDMGITAAAPSFSYSITGFDLTTGAIDAVPGKAAFNAFTPSVSNGQFVVLASGKSATLPLSVDTAVQATTPSLGWMVVSLDNRNGAAQAALIPVGKLPKH
ncbi:MAG: S8 family serine peptidase [Candidatus Limnocylindrales bacterium]|jgi:subtilisin family serine protease